MYTRIFFALITPSNVFVQFTVFLPVFSLYIFNLMNNKQWCYLAKFVINLVGYQYPPAQTPKPLLLRCLLKILQFVFDQTASYSQPACLCQRTLHHLNSKDIRNLHHNLWHLCQFAIFSMHIRPYACDIFFMVPCKNLHWTTDHACSNIS